MPLPLYDLTFNSPATNIKKLLSNGNLIWLRVLTNPKTGLKKIFPVVQKTGESVKAFYTRIADTAAAGYMSGSKAMAAKTDEARKKVTDWSNNWLKENFKKGKYKPRAVDDFINNYKKDWSKEIKARGYKDSFSFRYKDGYGFPPVSTRKKKYKIPNSEFFMRPSFKGNRSSDSGFNSLRKAFFENQLKTNTAFNNHVDDYFNFFLRNKTGASNQYKKITLPKGAEDAVFWLSPDSGITGVSRTDMFAKIPAYSKIFSLYQNKFSKRSSSVKNQKLLEKTLNLEPNYIRNLQRKEGEALKKLFGVTKLPPELAYSVEHAQGLASAVSSGDKKIMQAAINDLAGMSLARNMELGYSPGVFEQTRKQFIKKINDGLKSKQNMSKEVNELNKFIFEEYGGNVSNNKKPYSITGNKLQTSIISQATNQDQRFGQYFTELANNPKSSQTLLERINTRPELTKFVQEGADPILKSLRSTVINLAKNNTNNFCNILTMKAADGGRIGFAAGGNCATEVANEFDANPKKFAQDVNKTEGMAPKIKNMATRFLQGFKTSGSLKGKIALGAGAVIGGGGAAALVQQFRNDNPNTYLTNDRQMEGMIIADDIERDLEDMGFILDNEGKIELAATGALSASMVKKVYNAARAGEGQLLEMPTELDKEARQLRKLRKAILYRNGRKVKRITETNQQLLRETDDRLRQLSDLAKDTKLRGQELKTIVDSSGNKVQKLVNTGELINPGSSGRIMSALGLRKGVLGLGLNAFMSPAIALPTAAMSVARDIKSGKSTEDTLTNPWTYLPTAFMKSGMKGLAKMGATRGLMGIAGLGLSLPAAGAISIAGGLATLGSMGYQGYKMFKDRNRTDEGFYN